MSKQLFGIFKKIIYSSVLCAGVNYNVESSVATRHNLDQHIRRAAEQYLSTQGFNPTYIPERLLLDYEQKLETTKKNILDQLARQGRSYIDVSDIQATVRKEISSFADNLRTVIHDYQLQEALTQALQSYLALKGISQDDIPDRDIAEYINRSEKIMSSLQSIMQRDNRPYVRIFEIEKAIKDNMEIFIRRIRNSIQQASGVAVTYNQPTNTAAYDWVSTFFATPQPTPQAPITGPRASKVMNYELEETIKGVASNTLRSYSIDSNKLPVRALSEYNKKLQIINTKLNQLMANTGRNYVWRDEVEQTVLQEIQSVIDKINFKGESCSICLEDYRVGERIGLLSCSHHYHSNCIYTWLNQQKTCPLCRASNVFVEKIETIK